MTERKTISVKPLFEFGHGFLMRLWLLSFPALLILLLSPTARNYDTWIIFTMIALAFLTKLIHALRTRDTEDDSIPA